MMKRKLIEKISIISFICAVVLTSGGITLGSYLKYKKYRDEISANRVNNEPVLQSIDVQLKEGKNFYKNGKAIPAKSDFVVNANYKVGKDRSYEETLTEDQFEIEYDDNFVNVGGVVKVTFEDKENSITINLLDVLLEKINIVNNPYLVCYEEGSTFSDEGMVLEGVYNDGSKELLTSNDYVIETKTLTTSMTNAIIKCTKDGVNLECLIPITVMKKGEFSNGNIISFVARGEPIVYANQKLSETTNFSIRAKYDSGNERDLSPSDYIIANSDKVAEFGVNTVIKVTSKEDNSVYTDIPVKVISKVDSSAMNVIGGTTFKEQEYLYQNNQIVKDKEIEVVGNFESAIANNQEASISVSINSLSSFRSDLAIRVNNPYITKENSKFISNNLVLNTMLDLYVNGKLKSIDATSIIKGNLTSDDANIGNIYYDIVLKNILINEGSNDIKLVVKKNTKEYKDYNNEIISSLNIASINCIFTSLQTNLDLHSYLEICKENNMSTSLNSTNVMSYVSRTIDNEVLGKKLAHNGGQDLCSDGKYLYMTLNSANNAFATIAKIDLATNTIIANSPSFVINENTSSSWNAEDDTSLINCVKDKLYVSRNDGKFVVINKNSLEVENAKADLFVTPTNITSLVSMFGYNEEQNMYVVRFRDGSIYFYDQDFKLLDKNPLKMNSKLINGKIQSFKVEDNYIIASYNKDNYDGTEVFVMDYEGNILNNKIEKIFADIEASEKNFNVQGIVEKNGCLYAIVYSWNRNGTYLYRLEYNYSPSSSINYTLGEYYEDCLSEGIEFTYSIKENRAWLSVSDEADGKKYNFNTVQSFVTYNDKYYGVFNDGNNRYAKVVEYDVDSKKVINSSSMFIVGESESWNFENGSSFVSNNMMYVIKGNGKFVEINLDNLQIQKEDVTLFEVPSEVGETKIKAVAANKETEKYLVTYENGASYLYDYAYKLIGKANDNLTKSGYNLQTIYNNDDYVYAVYAKDNYDGCFIDVLDWNAKKIGTINLTNVFVDCGDGEKSFNVQNIFEKNGKLYVTLFSWNRGSSFIYEVTLG